MLRKIQREKDPVIILSRPPPPPYVVPYLAETPVSVVSQGKRPIWVNTDFFLGSTCVALEFKILIQQPRHVYDLFARYGYLWRQRCFIYPPRLYVGSFRHEAKKYKFPPSTAQFPQKSNKHRRKGFFKNERARHWSFGPLSNCRMCIGIGKEKEERRRRRFPSFLFC